jgi:hypothetical protein
VARMHEGTAMVCNVECERKEKKEKKITYLVHWAEALPRPRSCVAVVLRAMSGRRVGAGTSGGGSGGSRAQGDDNGLQR